MKNRKTCQLNEHCSKDRNAPADLPIRSVQVNLEQQKHRDLLSIAQSHIKFLKKHGRQPGVTVESTLEQVKSQELPMKFQSKHGIDNVTLVVRPTTPILRDSKTSEVTGSETVSPRSHESVNKVSTLKQYTVMKPVVKIIKKEKIKENQNEVLNDQSDISTYGNYVLKNCENPRKTRHTSYTDNRKNDYRKQVNESNINSKCTINKEKKYVKESRPKADMFLKVEDSDNTYTRYTHQHKIRYTHADDFLKSSKSMSGGSVHTDCVAVSESVVGANTVNEAKVQLINNYLSDCDRHLREEKKQVIPVDIFSL